MPDQSFDEFQSEADHSQEWHITFDDGTERETTLAWIAYRAMEDDAAEVEKI